MRAKITAAGAPYIQDVVITGLNEKEVGALIIPALIPCRKALGLPDSATMRDIAQHEKMQVCHGCHDHRISQVCHRFSQPSCQSSCFD